MKKVIDGFLLGVGMTLAFHLVGFLLSVGLYFAFSLINMLTRGVVSM